MSELTPYQQEAVQGIRDFAQFLENNPAFIEMTRNRVYHAFHYGDASEFGLLVGVLGECTKGSDDLWFNVEKSFGPLVTLQLTTRHENICEKVVVGTETIEVTERDEALVAEALASIPVTTTTKTVEMTRWECPPSLLALGVTK